MLVSTKRIVRFSAGAAMLVGCALVLGQSGPPSSYSPVVIRETFDAIRARMEADKAAVMDRQTALLADRYDLSDQPSGSVLMSRGKPIQVGVRVKLPDGMTWSALAALEPQQVRNQGVWPAGFYPLPHPHHQEGGMVFPQFHIDEVNEQEERDLTRFDLDYDLPDLFLPEFPPAIFLTTRTDLGDVSQGEFVTIDNFYRLFNGVLNPKQLDGLRLLLTPFPQRGDRRRASRWEELREHQAPQPGPTAGLEAAEALRACSSREARLLASHFALGHSSAELTSTEKMGNIAVRVRLSLARKQVREALSGGRVRACRHGLGRPPLGPEGPPYLLPLQGSGDALKY